MNSQSDPPLRKIAPTVYIDLSIKGISPVGRVVERTADKELVIDFGSRRTTARPSELKFFEIAAVQEGGVRQQYLANRGTFTSDWQEDHLGVLTRLIQNAPGALRLSAIQRDALECGLVLNDKEWSGILKTLRQVPKVTIFTQQGEEFISSAPAIQPGNSIDVPLQGEPNRPEETAENAADLDAVGRYLKLGQPEVLIRAGKRLAGLDSELASAEILNFYEACLTDGETFTPHTFVRLKDLVAGDEDLAAKLLLPVLNSGLNAITGSARTDRRELAQSLLALIAAWSQYETSKPLLIPAGQSLIQLLCISPPSKAWASKGRVTIILALAADPQFSDALRDTSIWSGITWSSLVNLLRDKSVAGLLVAGLLDAEPLREEVLRPAVTARSTAKDSPARRLADLATAPEPLQTLVTDDQMSKILLAVSRKSPQVGAAIRAREDLAVSKAAPEIRAAAITQNEARMRATLQEAKTLKEQLEAQAADLLKLQDKLGTTEEKLDSAEHSVRELRDQPRKEAEVAGKQAKAIAQQSQMEIFAVLGELLSDIAPLSAGSEAVRTIQVLYERRSAAIGLESLGVPGDIVEFDPNQHEAVDKSSGKVRIRYSGYRVAGESTHVVKKAIVEAL
jgi:hypothetical protein